MGKNPGIQNHPFLLDKQVWMKGSGTNSRCSGNLVHKKKPLTLKLRNLVPPLKFFQLKTQVQPA